MQEEKSENKPNLLADIRAEESPGRRSYTFFYAQAICIHFIEVQELRAEGFSMATICRFLEKKGALPVGADPHSFCRAYSREDVRRKRATKYKEQERTNGRSEKKNEAAGIAAISGDERKPSLPTSPLPGASKSKTGVQINPDNTFRIEPIDPDDLPEIENIKR